MEKRKIIRSSQFKNEYTSLLSTFTETSCLMAIATPPPTASAELNLLFDCFEQIAASKQTQPW